MGCVVGNKILHHQGSSGWINHQTDMRQISKRKPKLIHAYVQDLRLHESYAQSRLRDRKGTRR